MAEGQVKLADVIVPEVFSEYTLLRTKEKSDLITSGAITVNPMLQEKLNKSEGHVFHMPGFNSLDNDPENVANDEMSQAYGGAAPPKPKKIGTHMQIAVPLFRTQSWGSTQLVKYYIGTDPMRYMMEQISTYWAMRLQALFLSVMKGIFADNDANPTAGEHVKGDLTLDIKGNAFDAAKTAFSTEAFIEATGLLGDAFSSLDIILMHSVVHQNLVLKNLIPNVRDAESPYKYSTFMGRRIVINDHMPHNGGIYETWIFGAGQIAFASKSPENAVELWHDPHAGNLWGAETLFNRQAWCMHPVGHSYKGPSDSTGGPNNDVLARAGSWERVFKERKQIRIARLITREAAA